MRGEIKEGFFLRQFVGTSQTGDGREIEISLTPSMNPIIVFGKRAYILSWNDILNMAEEAGLFDKRETTVC